MVNCAKFTARHISQHTVHMTKKCINAASTMQPTVVWSRFMPTSRHNCHSTIEKHALRMMMMRCVCIFLRSLIVQVCC